MYHQHPQHRSPPAAWPGHPYHPAAKGAPAPHGAPVRAPMPPPIHFPPGRPVGGAYYPPPTHSPAGPTATAPTRRAPALVSPSTAAPVSPQAVTSSPAAATARAAPTTPPAAAGGHAVTAKPPRPYTEYTMFYQLEREFILHRVLTTDGEQAAAPAPGVALFQNDPLMPAKYRSLPLRADWYISGKSKKPTKRKHRKSHGKIGFLELTRMIAARWAKVDGETRKYCRMMAAMELVKYKEDMEKYNLYKERLARVGEVPEDAKERLRKKRRAAEKKGASKTAKSAARATRAAKRAVKPDVVRSVAMPTLPKPAGPRLEPLAHDSPQEAAGGAALDNDMERFITSMIRRPPRPRASAPGEMTVPLKDEGDQLDGIQMAFSGIDEDEIAREFAGPVVHRAAPAPSFDYWDALVEHL
ncbi:hypothetical protein ACHAXT_010230 [Thalassiosira profunda]